MAALYANHPYGVPIIGWSHEVASLDREDALGFYKRFYAPTTRFLVVAGDVDLGEVKHSPRRLSASSRRMPRSTAGRARRSPSITRR